MGGREIISSLNNFIFPSVMSSNPAISLNKVVFPQPEGPRRVKNSLSYIVKLAFLRAFTEEISVPYILVTFFISIALTFLSFI